MPAARLDSALLLVFTATVALAFKGVLARFAYAAGHGVDEVLLLRFAIAAPLFWLGVRWFARSDTPMRGVHWLQCSGAGALFFVATYADFTAVLLIGASLSRLVLFTFPIYVVLLHALLQRQPPSLRQLVTFALTYAGLALAVAPEGLAGLAGADIVGVLWAFVSAVSYALYLTASQPVMRSIGSARFTAASGSVTLLFMLLYLLFGDRFGTLAFTGAGVAWSSSIAIACTVLPFFLLFEGIRRCGASRASLVALSGPAITVVAAWVLRDERLTLLQVVGVVLVIAGIATLERPARAGR